MSRFNFFAKSTPQQPPPSQSSQHPSLPPSHPAPHGALGPNFSLPQPITHTTPMSSYLIPSSAHLSPSYYDVFTSQTTTPINPSSPPPHLSSPIPSSSLSAPTDLHSAKGPSQSILASPSFSTSPHLNTPSNPIQSTQITALFRFPIPQQRFKNGNTLYNHFNNLPLLPSTFSNTSAFAFSFTLHANTSIYSSIYRDAISSLTKVNSSALHRSTSFAVFPLPSFLLDKPTHKDDRVIHNQQYAQHFQNNLSTEMIEIIDEAQSIEIPTLSLSNTFPLVYSASTLHNVQFYVQEGQHTGSHYQQPTTFQSQHQHQFSNQNQSASFHANNPTSSGGNNLNNSQTQGTNAASQYSNNPQNHTFTATPHSLTSTSSIPLKPSSIIPQNIFVQQQRDFQHQQQQQQQQQHHHQQNPPFESSSSQSQHPTSSKNSTQTLSSHHHHNSAPITHPNNLPSESSSSSSSLVETCLMKSKTTSFSPFIESLTAQRDEEEALFYTHLQPTQPSNPQQSQQPHQSTPNASIQYISQNSHTNHQGQTSPNLANFNVTATEDDEEDSLPQFQSKLPSVDQLYFNSPTFLPQHVPLLSEIAEAQQEQYSSLANRIQATHTMSTSEWMVSHFPTIIHPMMILNDLFMTSYYLNVPVSCWEISNLQQQTLGASLPILTAPQLGTASLGSSSKTDKSNERNDKGSLFGKKRDKSSSVKDKTTPDASSPGNRFNFPNGPYSPHPHSPSMSTLGSLHSNPTFDSKGNARTSHYPGSQPQPTLLNNYILSFLPSNQQNPYLNSLSDQSSSSSFISSSNIDPSMAFLTNHLTRIPQITYFRSIFCGDFISHPYSTLYLPRFLVTNANFTAKLHKTFTVQRFIKDIMAVSPGHSGLLNNGLGGTDSTSFYLKLLHRSSAHSQTKSASGSLTGKWQRKTKEDGTTVVEDKNATKRGSTPADSTNLNAQTDVTTGNATSPANAKQTKQSTPLWYDDLVCRNFDDIQALQSNSHSSPSLLVYTVPLFMMLGDIFPLLNILAHQLHISTSTSKNNTIIDTVAVAPTPISLPSHSPQQHFQHHQQLPSHSSQSPPSTQQPNAYDSIQEIDHNTHKQYNPNTTAPNNNPAQPALHQNQLQPTTSAQNAFTGQGQDASSTSPNSGRSGLSLGLQLQQRQSQQRQQSSPTQTQQQHQQIDGKNPAVMNDTNPEDHQNQSNTDYSHGIGHEENDPYPNSNDLGDPHGAEIFDDSTFNPGLLPQKDTLREEQDRKRFIAMSFDDVLLSTKDKKVNKTQAGSSNQHAGVDDLNAPTNASHPFSTHNLLATQPTPTTFIIGSQTDPQTLGLQMHRNFSQSSQDHAHSHQPHNVLIATSPTTASSRQLVFHTENNHSNQHMFNTPSNPQANSVGSSYVNIHLINQLVETNFLEMNAESKDDETALQGLYHPSILSQASQSVQSHLLSAHQHQHQQQLLRQHQQQQEQIENEFNEHRAQVLQSSISPVEHLNSPNLSGPNPHPTATDQLGTNSHHNSPQQPNQEEFLQAQAQYFFHQQNALAQQQSQFESLSFSQHNNVYCIDEMDRIINAIDIVIDYLYSYRYCLSKRCEYLVKLQHTLLSPYIVLCQQHLVQTKQELKFSRNEITQCRKDVEAIVTSIESTREALTTSIQIQMQKPQSIEKLTAQLTKLREHRLVVMKQLDGLCHTKATKEQQYELLQLLYAELTTLAPPVSSNGAGTASVLDSDQPNPTPSTSQTSNHNHNHNHNNLSNTNNHQNNGIKPHDARSFHRCERAIRSEYLSRVFGKSNTVLFLYHLSLAFLLRLEWLRTMNKCLVISHTIEQLFIRQHDIISLDWC